MGRLAFSTLGCPGWDFETIVGQAKRLGYSAIEIRGIKNELRAENLSIFTPENLENTKKLLQDNGLQLSNIGTSVSFHDPANKENALAEGKAAIDICLIADIPAIRVFGDIFLPDDNEDTVIKRVTDCIGELCNYSLEKTGGKVGIWLEVHGDFNTLDIFSRVADLLSGNPCFGILWDIEHTYCANDDPVAFINNLKPLIKHTHFKDCILVDGKPVAVLPGEGTVPMKLYYDLLEENGYHVFKAEEEIVLDNVYRDQPNGVIQLRISLHQERFKC